MDEIWHAAGANFRCVRTGVKAECFAPGDKSSDLSWYSKRATLGAVYTAVELFMLTG